MPITKEKLLEELRENVVEVTFTKANGEERTLICTHRPDLLPDITEKNFDKEKKEAKKVKTPGHQIRVYDLEAGQWKSFIFDNLITTQILPNWGESE